MEQDVAVRKKRAMGSPSDAEFYRHCIESAPLIKGFMEGAQMVGGCKSASNYSYSASAYSSPHLRIVGDAGCFIDPYFSSGVHLALSSSLSAVATVQAARNKDCDEATAAKWHNDKVNEGYTVFLLIVLATMKQIRAKLEPILSDWDEEGFDRAFSYYRPSMSPIHSFICTELANRVVSYSRHGRNRFLWKAHTRRALQHCRVCNAIVQQGHP